MKRVKFSTDKVTGVKRTQSVDSSFGPVQVEYNPTTGTVRLVKTGTTEAVQVEGVVVTTTGAKKSPSVLGRELLVLAGANLSPETRIRTKDQEIVNELGLSAVTPTSAVEVVAGGLLDSVE
jgi:hypothetical protein